MPYGRKRALEIATTLALDPELMLLDEPTQGMGHEDVDRVAELIKKVAASRTVLMVEHNLSVVEKLCDRITVLQRGQILAEGPYAECLQGPARARSLCGSGSMSTAHPGTHGPWPPGRSDATAAFGQRDAAHHRPARLLRRIAHPARHRPAGEPRVSWSRCWAATARAARPR
jgi:ABC-type sugar transport system ATPase subunit